MGRERVKIFAIDETGIIVAGRQAFLFVAYEPFEDRILRLHLAWNPNSISVGIFLNDLVRKYGRHPVWTDGADWYLSFRMSVDESETPRLPARLVALGGHGESCSETEGQD